MRKILLSLLFLVLVPSLFFAQETFKVSGKVTDLKTGEALIGANILLKTLNLGAATDLEGNYSFDVPKSQAKGQSAELIASFVNYKKKTVKVVLNGSNIVQNFALEEDIFQNEEIVVTGIASKTAKSVAEVAVSRIPAAELTSEQSYSSFSQLVAGKIAGVTLQTGSGNVGSGWRFFVRAGGGLNGNEQPTIYLDGTRLDNAEIYGYGVGGQGISVLSNLNPNDIENIEVLKGPAAAAMYGTSGSNGVVLITTKRGQTSGGLGKGYGITYEFTYGMNNPSWKYDPANYKYANNINNLLSQTGLIQQNNFSITGGNNFLKYYTSFQSRVEKGLIPDQNQMDRKNLRLNLNTVPAQNLSINISSSYTWNKMSLPNNDNNIYGWIINAFALNPPYALTDSLSILAAQDYWKIDQFIGSVKAIWEPIPDLEITGGFGIDASMARQDRYYPYGYRYGTNSLGSRALYDRDLSRLTYDLNARYNFFFFDKLTFTTIVGTQLQDRKQFTNSESVRFFNTPYVTTLDAGAETPTVANTYFYGREAGIFWENNFSWDNTYFWTLGIRRDYASTFGTDAPSADYPKASAAVRLDKLGLDFFPAEQIQMLKLRASYGITGQLPGSLDPYPFTWTATVGGNGVGMIGNSIGNPGVKPESIKEFEIGIDIEFLKMFSLEFTHYRQNAKNSIVYSALAPSMGTGGLTYPFNVGAISNWGLESQLQFNPIRSIDYDLSFSFTWQYQTSKVENVGNTTELLDGQYNVEKVGWKKHEWYAQVSGAPVFDATGKLTSIPALKDASGNIIRVDKGNPIPDHSGAISMTFRFLKNFNLYVMTEFGLNNSIWSFTKYYSAAQGTYLPYNRLATQLGINTSFKIPVDPNTTPLTPGTPEYNDAANKFAAMYVPYAGNWIFPADYFSIKELSLSYDFTELMKEYLPNNYLRNLVVGFSVRNLYRTSKYDLDYDANFAGGFGAGTTFASDLATLPQPRTFNFWARFGF